MRLAKAWTLSEVCYRGGIRSYASVCLNGGVAPIPDLAFVAISLPGNIERTSQNPAAEPQATVKAAYEFTAQPRLGNGRGALERWPRKQALTIGRGAGTEQRGEVGPSHGVERIADRNVGKRHPPRHQEVATLQSLLE